MAINVNAALTAKWNLREEGVKKYLQARQQGEEHVLAVTKDWLAIFHQGFELVRVEGLDIRVQNPLEPKRGTEYVRVTLQSHSGFFLDQQIKSILIPAAAYLTREGFRAAVAAAVRKPAAQEQDASWLKELAPSEPQES